MLKRAATAVVLGPLVVWAVWKGPTWLVAVLVGLVTIGALWEFFGIAKRAGFEGQIGWTVFCAALLSYDQYGLAVGWVPTLRIWNWFRPGYGLGATGFPIENIFFIFVIGLSLLILLRKDGQARALHSTGSSVAAFFCVAFPLSFLVRILEEGSLGQRLVLFLLAVVWTGDILGYLVGKGIGKHAMAPVISPKKTWEGAVANFAGSVAVAWPFANWMGMELLPLLVTAGLANVAGQIGDLVESAYKRSAGVKDSGAILPGHGGILDRVDALIFATPVVWLYVVMWLS